MTLVLCGMSIILVLQEILNAAFEYFLVLFARHVGERVAGEALGVRHLAEHAAVGREQTLYREQRSVGIAVAHRGRAGLVHVLRGYLARTHQRLRFGQRGGKTAFAVGDSDSVDVAGPAAHQPWRRIGSDTRARQPRDMAADVVERERRAVVAHVADIAVRHQAQLDERLEAVADTEDQAVMVQKMLNRRRNARFTE